jgi:hypothetical protein
MIRIVMISPREFWTVCISPPAYAVVCKGKGLDKVWYLVRCDGSNCGTDPMNLLKGCMGVAKLGHVRRVCTSMKRASSSAYQHSQRFGILSSPVVSATLGLNLVLRGLLPDTLRTINSLDVRSNNYTLQFVRGVTSVSGPLTPLKMG